MKLTILGMNGPYPAPRGACSGYLLEERGTRIVLDVGPGVLARLMHYGLETLDAVILSHLHWDHCSDALPMRYALDARGIRLPLYAPEEPSANRALLDGWGGAEPMAIQPGQTAEVGAFQIAFFPMRHPVPAYGVRVESKDGTVFAYTGDTNTCDALEPLLKGADLALMDACFSGAQWKESLPHLSARLAAQAAMRAGVKQALLTHVTPGSDADLLLKQAQEVYPHCMMARKGMVYEV